VQVNTNLVHVTAVRDNSEVVVQVYTNLVHREALQAIVKFLHGLCHRYWGF